VEGIPDEIKVIAVSKNHPAEYILKAVKAGITCLGKIMFRNSRNMMLFLKFDIIQPEVALYWTFAIKQS